MKRAFPNSPHAIVQAKDDRFRLLIAKAGREKKIRQKHIAAALHVTQTTMTNRIQVPENTTLGELRKLREFLGWGVEELDWII